MNATVFTPHGNMDQNQACWRTSSTVGLPKQKRSCQNRLCSSFRWEDISNTQDTVWPPFQTPQGLSKTLMRCVVSLTLLPVIRKAVTHIFLFDVLISWTHLEVPSPRMACQLHDYKIVLCYTSLRRHCNFWQNQVFVKLLYLMWHPLDIHSLEENLG